MKKPLLMDENGIDRSTIFRAVQAKHDETDESRRCRAEQIAKQNGGVFASFKERNGTYRLVHPISVWYR